MHGGFKMRGLRPKHIPQPGNVRVLKDAAIAAFMANDMERFALCNQALDMWLKATGNKRVSYVMTEEHREKTQTSLRKARHARVKHV